MVFHEILLIKRFLSFLQNHHFLVEFPFRNRTFFGNYRHKTKKKVLFVAEKKAALDVVYKKLKDKGLDKFIFRLSSTAEKKTSIIEELKKRLDTKQPSLKSDLDLVEEEYIDQKKNLPHIKHRQAIE